MRAVRPASFDSATALVRATAAALDGRQATVLGAGAPFLRPVLVAANHLPAVARRAIYAAGSGREGRRASAVAGLRADDVYASVAARYRRRRYAGAVIGSTPGSLVHLCVAADLALLPQTVLVPLRRRLDDPDDALADAAVGRPVVDTLLRANPDVVCHQMFDPNADRLTLTHFAYLRLKRTRLGAPYERFLLDCLPPGATIHLADCRMRWPVATLGERHLYQLGGVGALSPGAYRSGSPEIGRFLARHGSRRRSWDGPAVDGLAPEAEWGFDGALADDVERFARRHGFRVRRLAFGDPDGPSAMVAELHRWWYRRRGRPVERCYSGSFVLVAPLGVLRAGAIPYWTTFNSTAAADGLERWLERSGPWQRVDVAVVNNGTESAGQAPAERWASLAARSGGRVRLAGLDLQRYPSDLAVFARYPDALRVDPAAEPPAPLSPDELAAFLDHAAAGGVTSPA